MLIGILVVAMSILVGGDLGVSKADAGPLTSLKVACSRQPDLDGCRYLSLALAEVRIGRVGIPVGRARNGRLPRTLLAKIFEPRHDVYLATRAAAAFNTLRIWSKRTLGVNLFPAGPRSAYRTYKEQVYFWNLFTSGRGALAAYPGTSNHGWGRAIDLASTEMASTIDSFGARFGWKKTEAFSEWWHYNYVGGFTRPDPGINARFPVASYGSGGFGQAWYVRELERTLLRLGYKRVRVDGYFGSATRLAVRDFEISKDLRGDGIVDRKTWMKLRNN
jgi:hypothetical protein